MNVEKVLGSHSNRLLEAVCKSTDLSNCFMALIGRLADECTKRGKAHDGLQIARPSMTDNRIMAKVTFSSLSLPSRSIEPEARKIGDLVLKENYEFAVFLQANPSLYTWLQCCLEMIDKHAREKGLQPSQVQFVGSIDDEDNILLEMEKFV